jgi:hypothetical protein
MAVLSGIGRDAELWTKRASRAHQRDPLQLARFVGQKREAPNGVNARHLRGEPTLQHCMGAVPCVVTAELIASAYLLWRSRNVELSCYAAGAHVGSRCRQSPQHQSRVAEANAKAYHGLALNRSASSSRSSAIRTLAAQMTVVAARSANWRYHEASSRSFSGAPSYRLSRSCIERITSMELEASRRQI